MNETQLCGAVFVIRNESDLHGGAGGERRAQTALNTNACRSLIPARAGGAGSRVSLSKFVIRIAVFIASATSLNAQISFTSAITLSLQNSPRVRMAQDDVNHALAALADTRDQFIPSVGATGGIGRSYGITLNVPTIVTINTQSLIFSYSQRDYIHAARESLQAATITRADVRAQVEEDAANTYLSLATAQLRHSAMVEEHGFAKKLVATVHDRVGLGMESELDFKKAHLRELEIQLQELYLEDEIGSLREHLSQLTGVSAEGLQIVGESIPKESVFSSSEGLPSLHGDDPTILSSEANAKAKLDQAFGDLHYAMRPQFLFQAQYGRVSPINDVSDYYNLHGRYDTFEAGVVIVLPFFDGARGARARETMADAMHAQHEAQNLRGQQVENRLGMQHSILELSTKAAVAEVQLAISQDQLTAMLAEVGSHDGNVAGRPMSTEDEQNARIEERQKYVDLLDATHQLQKARISFLRQTGDLDNWLASLPVQPDK